jgi:hypothetical protein
VRFQTTIYALCAVLLSASASLSADDLGFDAAGNTSMPWTQTDSAGYRWDIQHNGTVGDGNHDAYDGGLQLAVQGSGFSGQSQARVSKAGDEIELGPWNWNNQIQVVRRVYVDKKDNYARWVDLYRNTANQDVTVEIRYFSNLGSTIRNFVTASGKQTRDNAWAFATTDPNRSNTPALVHVVGTPQSKLQPEIKADSGTDKIYVTYRLEIPAGQTRGLFMIEMQRPKWGQAVKAMRDFKVHRALRKLPRAVRKVLANASTATMDIGGLDLPRDEDNDIVVLNDETELLGTITNEAYTIETGFGTLELPAARVVGMESAGPNDAQVRLALLDGQILLGTLTSGPIAITLANGKTLETPPRKLLKAGYRLSEDRPRDLRPDQPILVMHSGEYLGFRADDLKTDFLTEYGTVTLAPEHLQALILQVPEHGVHRAVFTNGSTLSGLLLADRVTTDLPLGPKLDARRAIIRQVVFPTETPEEKELCELTLRNESILRGAVLTGELQLQTSRNTITIAPAEIKTLTRAEGALRTFTVKLHSGTTVSGDVMNDSLQFAVQPGPTLDVFIGHINSLTCPKPEDPPTPKTDEADKPDKQDDSEDEAAKEETPEAARRRERSTLLRDAAAGQEAEVQHMEAQRRVKQITDITARLQELKAVLANLKQAKAAGKNVTDDAIAAAAARVQAAEKQLKAIKASE